MIYERPGERAAPPGGSSPRSIAPRTVATRAAALLLPSAALVAALAACLQTYAWRPAGRELLGQAHDAPAPSAGRFFALGACYVALVLLFSVWSWLRLGRSPPAGARSFRAVLVRALPWMGLALAAYPTTGDVYGYLQSGLMAAHGVNPFVVRLGEFPSPFAPLLFWRQTSTYGPVAQLLFIPPASLAAPLGVVAAVYGWKVLCCGAHVLNGFVLWRQLDTYPRRDALVLGYLIGPVVLFEHVAQAHLDVFLVTAVLVVFACARARRAGGALLAAGLGMAIKVLPLVWAPMIALAAWRWGRRRQLVTVLVASAVALTLAARTVLPTLAAWRSLFNPSAAWVAACSLHQLFEAAIGAVARPAWITPGRVHRVLRDGSLLVYTLYFAGLLWRKSREREEREGRLVVEIGEATFWLFLLATPWYQPWYATLLLPSALLVLGRGSARDRASLVVPSLVYAAASTSYYLVPDASAVHPFRLALVSFATVVPTALAWALGRRWAGAGGGPGHLGAGPATG